MISCLFCRRQLTVADQFKYERMPPEFIERASTEQQAL